jgi:putative intracellular protease/amidase
MVHRHDGLARQLHSLLLFLTASQELGAEYSAAADPWAPHAVADGNLITGQNPASSAAVAELVVKALSA